MASSIKKQFSNLVPGVEVTDGDKVYRITHLIAVDSVLADDLATGQSVKLDVETLRRVDLDAVPAPSDKPEGDRELLDYSETQWANAQSRLEAIKGLHGNASRTRSEVQRTAKLHGVHICTLYRWLNTYATAGNVSALVPSKRGRKTGTKRLADVLETIIQAVIQDVYLHKQRRLPEEVVQEVQRRCRLAKVAAPHPNTIRNRIRLIPDRERLRRRGHKEEAKNLYTALRGSFPGADHPFDFVQIDHTPLDVITVDETHRKSVGRPYLTLAIDVFSRMVAGIYISYDPPSAASVGICLAQAMCAKRDYLANLGVEGKWPVWGVIGTVHCDNAREFRGVTLERGCKEYGIDIGWRPVKIPNYGGHIERMMGNVATELHKLPGTTFSNTRDRKGYDSLKESALTLKELERYLIEFIVNVYHQRVHSELEMSPIRKWELGLSGDDQNLGVGIMQPPQDPDRLLIDFLPAHERTIQPYGVRIEEINYYDPVLDPYINAPDLQNPKQKRKFKFRYDPRDISKIYFFDPLAERYCTIPYRNIGHPAISLSELKEVRRKLKEEGRTNVDESLIFEGLDKMRTRIAESIHKTKSARRQAQRNPTRPVDKIDEPASTPVLASKSNSSFPPAPSMEEDDPFQQPARPFEDIALTGC